VVRVRAGVIAPVVPSLAPGSGMAGSSVLLVRGPLPLPSILSRRMSTVVYGLSAVDDRGRVTDRAVMRGVGLVCQAPSGHPRIGRDVHRCHIPWWQLPRHQPRPTFAYLLRCATGAAWRRGTVCFWPPTLTGPGFLPVDVMCSLCRVAWKCRFVR
jgi:hypothetical protein